MAQILLATSNLLDGGASIIRRPLSEKSNIELTSGLRNNILHGEIRHSERTYYVPDVTKTALLEERDQYDVTVKLFLLPETSYAVSEKLVRDAIKILLKQLDIETIDLLIVSFSGILFDADDDEDNIISDAMSTQTDRFLTSWRVLEELHDQGTLKRIGLAEFGSERLKQFLSKARIKPAVDQINVRDCCVVPKSLINYAKQESIELLTHSDCTDILPKGTVRSILTEIPTGLVSKEIAEGDVVPQWVIKYTAVIRNRGVVENKGYIAMADIRDTV